MGMGEDDFNKREERCRVIDGVGGEEGEEALPIKRDKQQALGVISSWIFLVLSTQPWTTPLL